MQRWKKIALIIGFVVIVITVGYLIYTTFFRPIIGPTPAPPVNVPPANLPGLPEAPGVTPPTNVPVEPTPPITPTPVTPPTALPEGVSEIAKGGLTQTTSLTTARANGATIDTTGENLIYYNKNLGQFYRVFPDGRAELMSDKKFFNVENINWSPMKNKAILEYPDGSNIVYNFENNNQTTLPKHWQDFDFSPSGDRIASKSMGVDINNRWLIVSEDDGSNARAIQDLRDQADKVIVDWSPNQKMVAMFANADTIDRQKLYFIGQNNENFRLLTLPGYGFEGQWSPSGDQMLFSVYNSNSDFQPELWITNIDTNDTGSDRRSLNINTWASKCAFSGESTAYCAVPRSLKQGYGFFDEFKAETQDDFYRVNLKTGQKTLVAEPYGDNYAVDQVMVSEDGKDLFFTDYATGRVHIIKLSE